jgi:hypothetical protein
MRTYCSRLSELARTLASLQGSAERSLFLRVFLLAPWVSVLMRLPLLWLSQIAVRPVRRSEAPPPIPPERIAQIVGLAQACGDPLVRRGCLTRGVSLLWIFRRCGIEVELAFGIGGPGDHNQGHCWLLRDGKPYLEPEASGDRFVELFRLPPGLADDRRVSVT